MNNFKKILFLSPHCDDIEFSCGGTMSRFIEEDLEVKLIVFSFCEESVPNGLDKDILQKEFIQSMNHYNRPNFSYSSRKIPVRMFPDYRSEILDYLYNLNNSFKPDLVLTPNSQDVHQDHKTINQESIRAFKKCKIIGYELPWNNINSINNFHIKIEERHLQRKINSIEEYNSQLFRGYSDQELFRGLARVRGSQIGTKYAESFELIRWII